MIKITIDDLMKICNTCKYRNKSDNLFNMSYWSRCQTKCKFSKLYDAGKITETDLEREKKKLHE